MALSGFRRIDFIVRALIIATIGGALGAAALMHAAGGDDDAGVTDTHGQTGLLWSLNSDPTAGAGIAGPLWQLLVRTDVPSIYYKSGTGNTAWTNLSGGGGGGIGGSGTLNTIPKFTAATTIGDSKLTDDDATLKYNSTAFMVAASTGNSTVLGSLTADAGNRVVDTAPVLSGLTQTNNQLATSPMSVFARFFSDFAANSPSNGLVGDGPFTAAFAGTGSAITAQAGETLHPGIWRFNTGTTTTGRASVLLGGTTTASSIIIGGTAVGAWEAKALIRPQTLCDNATQVCTIACGFIDTTTAADSTNGIYFKFDPAASANWRKVTVNGGTKTETDVSPAVAPSAGTWQTLGIQVNDGATSATFTINGAAAGTNSTNMPNGDFGIGCMILKSAGTTSRQLDVDYISSRADFSASGPR